MALLQFIYQHIGCPLDTCQAGKFELAATEEVQITLDPKNPDWTLEFIATVISVTKTDAGRDYLLEYDDAVIGAGGVMFEGCDIASIEPYCCCDALDARVTVLENAAASIGSISFTEDDATGVITMTVTDTAGSTVVSTVQDSTLTMDSMGNLVDPAGNIVVEAGKLVDTVYVANADGSTTITVDGLPVLTTIIDTDTTYTFNSDGTVTDSNGVIQTIVDTDTTYTFNADGTVTDSAANTQTITADSLSDDAILGTFGDMPSNI